MAGRFSEVTEEEIEVWSASISETRRVGVDPDGSPGKSSNASEVAFTHRVRAVEKAEAMGKLSGGDGTDAKKTG